LAVQRAEELLALLMRDVVHVALDDQQRRLDIAGMKERAVAHVSLGVLPRRSAHPELP